MQINVAQLLKQAAGASRSYKIDATLSFEELAEYHVQGEVGLIRTEKGILVRGVFSGKSSLMCSRCLTFFDYPLTFKIEEEFFPSIDVISGIPLPLADDSTAFTVDEHHVLDLSEAIRQYGLLAVPMKPLCRPDCAGLCPQCGANLNQGACHCVPGSQESAWSELEKLNSIRKSR
jgi:uncharacterized protein